MDERNPTPGERRDADQGVSEPSPVTVWVVGQSRSGEAGNVVWDLQGVFTTEAKAIAACKFPNYCYWPAVLDEELPHETLIAPAVFPRTE